MTHAPAPQAIDVAIDRVLRVYGSWRRNTSLERMRNDWDQLFPLSMSEVATESVMAGGVDSLWIAASGADVSRTLVYFHGGGYKIGSTRSHLDLMARISQAARCRVLGVNYRLAPGSRFPAPVRDSIAVYEWLLTDGVAPRTVAFAGDSAGGGLVASSLLALRDAGTPLPAAGVLMSAWTDMTASGASFVTRAAADPIHQRSMILSTALGYLGESADPTDPLASPLFGDLRGLPPLLLQVGDRETVLDDSTRFAAKAEDAGVRVELEIYAGMIHVFQQFADILPEAEQAIGSIGRFLSSVWPH